MKLWILIGISHRADAMGFALDAATEGMFLLLGDDRQYFME
jgi:hypothetical protein